MRILINYLDMIIMVLWRLIKGIAVLLIALAILPTVFFLLLPVYVKHGGEKTINLVFDTLFDE